MDRLLKVQDIDLKIRTLERTMAEVCRRSVAEDPKLVEMQREITRLDESTTMIESQRQMYQQTLEDIRTAIKGLSLSKSGGFKPRTRSSTEALKAEDEKLSALIVETDGQIARLAEQRQKLVEAIQQRSTEIRTVHPGPEAEVRKLRAQIRKLGEQRDRAAKGIPKPLLHVYDRLRNSSSGIGLTILRDGVCSVCRMQMPTAIQARVLRGEMIPSCPACGRMVARLENTGAFPLPSSASRPEREPDEDDEDNIDELEASEEYESETEPAHRAERERQRTDTRVSARTDRRPAARKARERKPAPKPTRPTKRKKADAGGPGRKRPRVGRTRQRGKVRR